MRKWTRANYMPNKALYEHKGHVTASPEHLALSREAACEGMILLKNDTDLLPFSPGQKVAVFGKALFDYVKGGGGSGDVSVSHVYSLYDGLSLEKESIKMHRPLVDFYRDYVENCYEKGALPGLLKEPLLPERFYEEAGTFTDTALIVLSRFSGEGWDRQRVTYEGQEAYEAGWYQIHETLFEESDYYLTREEKIMIEEVKKHFDRIALVLNVGGLVDSSWFAGDNAISSVLLAWQAGMEGGAAMADLLMGRRNPCGKLPDTLAADLSHYPGVRDFHRSPLYVDYSEDIYVGYRYFETIPGKKDLVNYPFGFGLSYTSFSIEGLMGCRSRNEIILTVRVKNTGQMAGKEVVQVYVQAPQGRLGKAAFSLVDFEKTGLLAPGETQLISFSIPFYAMASYDETRIREQGKYILEKGTYTFYAGNSVRSLSPLPFELLLEEDRILRTLPARCCPTQLENRLLADGSYEDLPLSRPHDHLVNVLGWSPEPVEGVCPAVRGRDRFIPSQAYPEGHPMRQQPALIQLIDVADGKAKLTDLLDQMSDQDLCDLLGGQPNQGVANTFGFGNNPDHGIPNLMTTDGPAGVRILPEYEIYTTALPCATLLASTWNRDLLCRVGIMAAEEIKENNLSIWLAPAVNIHRNPLCGRNFEYYSEDPVLAGELAASLIRGVQSLGVGACVKHFACNNKESNRKESDSRISERALREIYIKQFEIIIKKADPWVVMSSYNLINGQRASENKDLLTGILREEWGYEGVVCSDWYTHGEHYKELLAGNDIKMGCGYPDRLMMALEKGAISRQDLLIAAERVLQLILKAD